MLCDERDAEDGVEDVGVVSERDAALAGLEERQNALSKLRRSAHSDGEKFQVVRQEVGKFSLSRWKS